MFSQGSKPPKIPTKSKSKSTPAHELTMVEQINELENQEESEDDDSNQQSIFTSSQKAKKIAKNLDEAELREYVCNFIRSDEELHLNALNYIPLDFESVHARLQECLAPRRANNKLLMKVLDEFCVTFTLKNCSTKTHQGKPKYKKKR